MKNLRCVACKTDHVAVREMRADEVALIGYTPEDMRVCTECESIYDTLTEVPEHDDLEER